MRTAWGYFQSDPRHFQMLTLSTLLSMLLLFSDFAPSLAIIALTVTSTILTQFFFYKALKIKSDDYRSPLITSLSLCLLFKSNIIWLFPLVGIIAMASKFLIRVNGKHLFNPANGAIVAMLLIAPDYVWVSPGQWGFEIWVGFALICLASMVLSHANRVDTSLFFLGFWFLLIFGRSLWLGDPIDIPLHTAQSGALLIFAFFMISDPMTTPNNRWGRLCFAVAVALLAYILQYIYQIREAIFYALFFICCFTPVIDMIFQQRLYKWREQT